jgi:ribosomal protein S18 acetylase RimI-like enzyme
MLTQTLIPYAPEYRRQAVRLIGQARYRHFHLDWQQPIDWLAERNICCWVAWDGKEITTLVGASVEQDGAAWLRLVAASDDSGDSYRGDINLPDALWARLREDLRACGVREVGVLLQEYWLRPTLRLWGFESTNAVVTLRRSDGPVPPYPLPPLAIRDATLQDIPAIVRVDAAAFSPLWRYDERTIWLASKLAATFTVLTLDESIVGYQLSTHHGVVGHLARLAVDPPHQGQGYGGLLIGEMLRFFASRNVEVASVNTQEDNVRSQQLYKRLGYQFTGHRAPVWTMAL